MRFSLLLFALFLVTIPQTALADDAWQLTWGREPTWSPDGTQIAFNRWGTVPGVFVIPVTGGTATEIYIPGEFPDWSPDGTQIAFSAWTGPRNAFREIRVIPATGGGWTYITDGEAPSWSPDGSMIAFQHWEGGDNYDIWVIPAAGGTATQITTDPAYDFAPAWSPDGSQIAFGSDRSGNWDIWVIPATGGPPFTLITDDLASDGSPTWSPDGTQLAFARYETIWIIDAPVAVEPTTWGAIKASFK